jgi:PIN domain nuclease of toxin-antitoxin system
VIYLDTHVVVWLYYGRRKRLSREASRCIERAQRLLISPAVELELEYLFRRSRISHGPGEILSDLRARIGLSLCDLPFALVSHQAVSLTWTDDVFDRLIVAQAAATEAPLLTADTVIGERYAQAVW